MDWNTDLLLIVNAIIVIVYIAGTWHYGHFKKIGVPYIKPFPIVGNMWRVVCGRTSFGDHVIYLYDHFKAYGVGGFFEFLTPVTMICDPEIIRLITIKDFDYFTDHKVAIREDVDPLFGRNMFTLQGQRWRDMRNTLSPAFTSSKMKAMFHLIQETGNQLGNYLEKKCKASKDNLITMEMKDLLTRYTNDVIASAAFGLHCDSLEEPDNEFYMTGKAVSTFGRLQTLKFLGFLFSIKVMKFLKITFISKKCGDFFRHLVRDTINTRERENIIRPDMIHLLMQAKKGMLSAEAADEGYDGSMKEKGKEKMEFNDEDITANALLFFLAGFDTSSTLLCFTCQLLAMHPDIQRRLQEEIDQAIEMDGGKITYEGIQKMKYMDMVISETLRMYPPAVFTDRLCIKAYVLEETANSPRVHMKPGDGLMLPIIALHRDPELYPDPEKFDPERFSEENKHKIKPFTYLPFGIGPRQCIGMRFALLEAKIAMICLLTRFNLEVVSKTSIPMVLLRSSISVGIEGGFWLGIRPRTISS